MTQRNSPCNRPHGTEALFSQGKMLRSIRTDDAIAAAKKVAGTRQHEGDDAPADLAVDRQYLHAVESGEDRR